MSCTDIFLVKAKSRSQCQVLVLGPEEQVLDFLKDKPAHTEVVLTGRDPSPALLDLADYVSEIKKIKHPFDRGLAARIGIEE